jgi:hypothetical protein
MIYIKKIVAINLQIHKKITLEFDESFNVIFSDNNRGKSSITRALKWFYTNSPNGDWMRRIDKDGNKKTCKFTVYYSDGTFITRIKGKKENKYILNGIETYTTVNRNIPNKIKEYFNLNNNIMDLYNINPYIITQEDDIFLIKEKSNKSVSGAFNVLSGIEKFEKIDKFFNRDKLDLSNKIKYDKELLTEKEKQLAINKKIDSIDFKKIENINEQRIKKKNQLIKLKNLYSVYINNIKYLNVEKYIDKLGLLKNKINNINSKLNNLIEIKSLLTKYNIITKINIIDLKENINKALELQNILDLLLKFDVSNKEYNRLLLEFEKIKITMQEFKGYCPLCRSKINGIKCE